MNEPETAPTSPEESQRLPRRALRNLFLTLFLRGRSSRGLQKQKAPKSIGTKLALTLVFYVFFGLFALIFIRQPVFSLAVYLHAMTFIFLGMFVASSSGEVLFNKEEADILLHRPIEPKTLLWAKIRVLVEVSLWLAFAFNLVGFFVGLGASNGDWRFPVVHVFSLTLEAVFCTGCVVLIYQLCLRWFGRERLDGFMTMAQVAVSIAMVLSGQILPRLMFRLNSIGVLKESSGWIGLLPPAWFAGIDDALAGSMAASSWRLALAAVLATGLVLWLAFGKLAHDYETGLQRLGEGAARRANKRASRRWIDILVGLPPLKWWLRDPVTRASFLLTAAYLARDRDVKLRVYPAMAPLLILPIVFMMQGRGGFGANQSGFGVSLGAGYLGIIPMQALMILQYSQQWQAADIFHIVPLRGPAPLCHGARRAVMCFLALPMMLVFALIIWFAYRDTSKLLLLLPGLIFLPIMALIPNIGGNAVPLSRPTEEAKSTGRGMVMMGAVFVSMLLSLLATAAAAIGLFWWLILAEFVVAVILYFAMHRSLANARWQSCE